jgi:hypothetical protein
MGLSGSRGGDQVIVRRQEAMMIANGIFVPRWRNSNPDVRRQAVDRLKDIELLRQIAEKDADPVVSQAAFRRLAQLQVKETVP